jgi:hypothetical protein
MPKSAKPTRGTIMAKMNLYVVYDKIAGECGPVFEAKNDGVAMRQYRHLINENPTVVQDDFSLMQVGTIDKESMIIEPLQLLLDLENKELEEVVNE